MDDSSAGRDARLGSQDGFRYSIASNMGRPNPTARRQDGLIETGRASRSVEIRQRVKSSAEATKSRRLWIGMAFDAIGRPLGKVKIVGSGRHHRVATQIRPDVDTQKTFRIARDHKLPKTVGFSIADRNLELNALGLEVFAFPF